MIAEVPAAVALLPLELAGYQDGSVVSRVLTRSGGTITFFAFDVGQGLGEHTAPFDAVAHVLEEPMFRLTPRLSRTGPPCRVAAGRCYR